uniref:(northern house mosquito) hypothetical protein n=1 Tax=Culex pipiens TaxID=7175 RepID=A0A8D8CBB4_CULPI
MGPGLRVLMDYERVYLDTLASAKQFVEDYTAEQHSVQLTGWKQMIDGLDDQYFANRLNIELLLDDESAAMTTEAAMSAVDDSNRRIRQKFELDYVFVYSFLVNEIKKQPTCPEANLNQTIPVRSHMKLLDPRLSNHVPVLHSPQTFSSDSHNPEQLRPLTSKTTYAVNCPASSSYPCCSHHTTRLLMSHDRISTHTSPVVSRPLPVFLEIQSKQTSSHTHSSSLPSPSMPQSPLVTCLVPINSVGARSVPASALLQTVNIVLDPHDHPQESQPITPRSKPDNPFVMHIRFHLKRIALIADIGQMSPPTRKQSGHLLAYLWIELNNGTTSLKVIQAKAKRTPSGRLKAAALELRFTIRFHNAATIEPKKIASQHSRWKKIVKNRLKDTQKLAAHASPPVATLFEIDAQPLRQPTTDVVGMAHLNSEF